jgi:hypothetical protein
MDRHEHRGRGKSIIVVVYIGFSDYCSRSIVVIR